MKKIFLVIILILTIFFSINFIYESKYTNSIKSINAEINDDINANNFEVEKTIIEIKQKNNEIDDWRLILVNYENILPENFNPQLSYIDSTRQFDSRAINELNQMLKDMKKDGIFNIWVQSAYRSFDYQQGLFNDKVDMYMKQGKTREDAEKLTLKKINRPGTSEHNLGLAVDFNYVDYSFDNTKGFKWLQENAENYGFIFRYKKEKEDITKVDYEPWHWRYVGIEHAKKINELDMCLEEYIEYLKTSCR